MLKLLYHHLSFLIFTYTNVFNFVCFFSGFAFTQYTVNGALSALANSVTSGFIRPVVSKQRGDDYQFGDAAEVGDSPMDKDMSSWPRGDLHCGVGHGIAHEVRVSVYHVFFFSFLKGSSMLTR